MDERIVARRLGGGGRERFCLASDEELAELHRMKTRQWLRTRSLANDQHGTVRVVHDLLTDRSEHQVLEPSAAAVSNDDELGVLGLS